MLTFSVYGLDEGGRIRVMELRRAASVSDVVGLAETYLATCQRVEVWGPEGRAYRAEREPG